MTNPKPIWIIRFPDGTYAASPLTNRTLNRHMAGAFSAGARALADETAARIGGEVVDFNAEASK